MEVTGKITQIDPIQTVKTKKGDLVKQNFLILTLDKFPKTICMTLWNNTVSDMLYEVGDTVTCFFDIESREYQGKYYTDVKAWKVLRPNQDGSVPQGSRMSRDAENAPAKGSITGTQTEDPLPF